MVCHSVYLSTRLDFSVKQGVSSELQSIVYTLITSYSLNYTYNHITDICTSYPAQHAYYTQVGINGQVLISCPWNQTFVLKTHQKHLKTKHMYSTSGHTDHNLELLTHNIKLYEEEFLPLTTITKKLGYTMVNFVMICTTVIAGKLARN